MTPQECVLDAVLRAQGILAEYIEPGRHDCEQTITRLFDIFDDRDADDRSQHVEFGSRASAVGNCR